MNIEELQSKTISFLRFPLIIGIVFIHNSLNGIKIDGQTLIGFYNLTWLDSIQYLFSDIHNTGILIGIIFYFMSAVILLKKKKVKLHPFLGSASFFVFAAHEPLMMLLRKLLYHLFPIHSESLLILFYFIFPVIIILFLLTIYKLLVRFVPKVTYFITGGR